MGQIRVTNVSETAATSKCCKRRVLPITDDNLENYSYIDRYYSAFVTKMILPILKAVTGD